MKHEAQTTHGTNCVEYSLTALFRRVLSIWKQGKDGFNEGWWLRMESIRAILLKLLKIMIAYDSIHCLLHNDPANYTQLANT